MNIKKYKLALLLSDLLIIASIIAISYFVRYYLLIAHFDRWYVDSYLRPAILMPFAILFISFVILFKNAGLYRMHILFDSYYQFVVFIKSILVSYGILITFLFFVKHPLLEQRRLMILNFLHLLVLFPFYRIVILKYISRFALKKKIIGERVVLIGADDKGREIAKELLKNKYAYFTPVGFLDDSKEIGSSVEGVKIFDKVDNIDKYTSDFDEILIALTDVSYNDLQRIIQMCQKLNKPIHIVSDLYRIVMEKVEVEKFDGIRTFQVPPVTGFSGYPYLLLKRLIDYVIALGFIILFLPVWIIIAILIKIGSEGPIFYKADVVGYKEKTFSWYKFRTMYSQSDDSAHRKLVAEIAQGIRNGEKLKDDPRITGIGKWLRKYSLDEFPQLINVVKGQMSLVGPRPVLPYEFELLENWQKERFTVLPGMTGLWQIRGRNKVNFKDQHVLDLYYVKNRNIILDTTILFNTISVVLSGKTGI